MRNLGFGSRYCVSARERSRSPEYGDNGTCPMHYNTTIQTSLETSSSIPPTSYTHAHLFVTSLSHTNNHIIHYRTITTHSPISKTITFPLRPSLLTVFPLATVFNHPALLLYATPPPVQEAQESGCEEGPKGKPYERGIGLGFATPI